MTKTEIQETIINTIVDNNCRGIILSSVRSGKTRMLIKSIDKHSLETTPSILILYPNVDVRVSWEREFELLQDELSIIPEITYSTFASIEKVKDNKYSYVLIDEAHLLGEENQLPIAGEIAKNNKHVIFASGTYNKETLSDIKLYTGMDLIVNYSTEEAIKDGIVSDFSIFVHQYELDNKNLIEFGKTKKWKSTEKKECSRLGNRIINTSGQQKMFAALERMRFINSTSSLFNTVKKWIKDNPNERFILFSSSEKTGEKYQLPMFNSKSKDDSILKAFQDGNINRLCLIKKASAGVTFPNLSNILITAINSNGENLEQMIGRSLLDDTAHSNIHIFVSTEIFQQNWLKKSLESINKNKIIYI
jgi:superfamily II DNA or RNA helicase